MFETDLISTVNYITNVLKNEDAVIKDNESVWVKPSDCLSENIYYFDRQSGTAEVV